MRTRKLYHYLFTSILLFSLISCESDETENGASSSTQNDEVEVDYAPSNINGKTIKIDSETRFYDFTSSGSCSAYCSTLENVYGTPQYSYSRTNATRATFWTKYVDKRTEVSEYTNTRYTYYRTSIRDYTLTFTSESGGTYAGTLTISTSGYSVGSIYVSAKTKVYSPNGSFSIY